MQIRIAITGRNYHTAQSAPECLTLPDDATLDDALQALADSMPAGQRLPGTCLVAVSGTHLGTLRSHQPRTLQDGDELLLLSPVAGG